MSGNPSLFEVFRSRRMAVLFGLGFSSGLPLMLTGQTLQAWAKDAQVDIKKIAALSLVPLIEVAWADGEIQSNERTAILQGAHGKGLEQGTDGYELLESWLKKRPAPALLDAWEGYIKALASQLNDEQNRLLKNQIVGFAKMVAASAGGFLGIGKVSASEEKVLSRIESAFNR